MSILFHSNIYNVKKLFALDFSTNDCNIKNKQIFNIPFYQREYVWDDKNAKKLVTDIGNAQHNNADQYFLGGIVLCAKSIANDNTYIDVVDGQQRIMTITILLAVLYNYLQKNKDIFLKEESNISKKKAIKDIYENNYPKIKKMIVENKSSLSEGTKSFYKISASESIKLPFKDFINYAVEENKNGSFNDIKQYEIKENYNNKKTCDNLVKVANAIHLHIDENYNNIKEIDSYVSFLRKKLLFVVTITDDIDTAFQIFETLNDRGIGLSADDLIKSYIIKNAKSNYKILSEKWEVFLKILRDKKGKYLVKPIDFFDWMFLSKGEDIKGSEIFSSFRKHCNEEEIFKSDDDIEKYIDSIISYAKFYKKSEIDHPGLKKISFGHGHSTLIALHKIKSKPEKVAKFLIQIERFAIVYFISNKAKIIKSHLSKINKILNDHLPNMEITNDLDQEDYNSHIKNQENKIDETYKIYVKTISKYIKDCTDEFEVSLMNTYFGKSGIRYKQGTYMLSIIAKKIGGAKYDLLSKDTTIEHIMPWKNDHGFYNKISTEDYDKYKGRIGNFTILDKKFNGALGSGSFEEKVDAIKKAKLDYLTSSLVDARFEKEKTYAHYRKIFNYTAPKQWDIDSIKDRTEAISRLAKYIWIDGNI